MTPTARLFSRYRAFREPTRLDLAPLTVVIGKNGSGKSVLTRLPLLIAGGIDPEVESPLDLRAGGISHAVRFEDLIYQRSAQAFALGVEISRPSGLLQFVTTLRHVVETHALGIEAFELLDSGQRVLNLKVSRPEDIGKPRATFVAQFGLDATEHELRAQMAGLFPVEIEGHSEISERLRQDRNLFSRALASTSYLGPFRTEQGSLPRIPRQGVRRLGVRGVRPRGLDGLVD